MANHWKFECPNRKIWAAKDKLSTFSLDRTQLNSVHSQNESREQVNSVYDQSNSRSIDHGKKINIDLLSDLSNKSENIQSPVGRKAVLVTG